MDNRENITLPTTVDGLEKLVHRIVAETFRRTADVCNEMEQSATTGDDHKAEARRKAVLEALERASRPNQGSTPAPARPETPTLGGQGLRTTNVATHGEQAGDRAL